MADQEKVIKAVEDAFDLVYSDFIGTDDFDETEWEQNKTDALSLLKEQKLVLCKDCKYLNAPANGVPFCKHIKKFVDAEWFCADGKKKDNQKG